MRGRGHREVGCEAPSYFPVQPSGPGQWQRLAAAENAPLSREWMLSFTKLCSAGRLQCLFVAKGQQTALLYLGVRDVHSPLLWLFFNDT